MQAFVKECTWMILKWYKIIRFLFYHNVFFRNAAIWKAVTVCPDHPRGTKEKLIVTLLSAVEEDSKHSAHLIILYNFLKICLFFNQISPSSCFKTTLFKSVYRRKNLFHH